MVILAKRKLPKRSDTLGNWKERNWESMRRKKLRIVRNDPASALAYDDLDYGIVHGVVVLLPYLLIYQWTKARKYNYIISICSPE